MMKLVDWIFSRRRQRVDIQTTEIENLRKIAAEWRQTANEWKDLADEYQAKLIGTLKEVDRLRVEVAELRNEVSTLRKVLPNPVDKPQSKTKQHK